MSFLNSHLFTNPQDEKLFLKDIQPPTMMLLIGICIDFTKKANESYYSISYCCCHDNLLEFFPVGCSASFNQSNWVLHKLPTWLYALHYLIHGACLPTPQLPRTCTQKWTSSSLFSTSVISHRRDRPRFIYPITYWRKPMLLSGSGNYGIKLL